MARPTPSPAEEPAKKKKMNRREFLNFAWLASLGFLTVNVAGITYLFTMPRFKAGEFGGVFPYGKASELPQLGDAPQNFPKVKLWMSKTEEGVTAIYKVCTHLGCLYGWSDQADRFVCPCHGSQFTKDGKFIAGPAPRSLDRFPIQVVSDGQVIAETNANGDPLQIPDDPNAEILIDTGTRIPGAPHA
ncbi:MAG: Rieske 2Fe-2S domain-containing protein [Anaerolineales bacterium]|jgi:cytochrome b6-f complex iron-sulfur subunit|nr:Rieske 2Fe-2S domain-containing protein [Anaerolineales bacterium]